MFLFSLKLNCKSFLRLSHGLHQLLPSMTYQEAARFPWHSPLYDLNVEPNCPGPAVINNLLQRAGKIIFSA